MGVTKHIKKLFKSSNAVKDKILVTGGLGYRKRRSHWHLRFCYAVILCP